MAAGPTIIVVVQDIGEGWCDRLEAVKSAELPWVVACGSELANELRAEIPAERLVPGGWRHEGRSLVAAAVLARPQSAGWLVIPAGLGVVQASTLRQLAWALEGYPLVYPQYQGLKGEPMGFGPEFFSELMVLPNDDAALRRLLARYAGFGVDVEDPGVLRAETWSRAEASAPGGRLQVLDAYQGK